MALATALIIAPSGQTVTMHTVNALSAPRLAAVPQFHARINGEATTGAVFGVFLMPGERIFIDTFDRPPAADLQLDTAGYGTARTAGPGQWRWRAPSAPGWYPLVLRNRATGGTLRLNIFVKIPFTRRQTRLAGYKIGHYQPLPADGDPVYAPPRGLVQVTPANQYVRIAPHFTLGQFLCHQQPDHWPKAQLVRPRLLNKLERIIDALEHVDITIRTLTIMSGYRTPQYNAAIGNTTVYSRHLYGGAADIFVDADNDGEMDDLNADGVIDIHDANWLADLVATITATDSSLIGGLSAYPANAYHGPFVHIDVRGTPARW